MARTMALIISAAFILVSCDAEPAGDQPVKKAPEKSALPVTTPSVPALPTAKTEKPAAKPEGLAGAAAQPGKEAIAKAVAKTADEGGNLEALAGALDASVSADKLKGLIENIRPAALEDLAGKLAGAIQSQNGAIDNLKEQIANLGAGDILGDKGVELKKSLEDAAASLTALTDKLKVVVDKLKAEGLDISKYTKLLGGE